MEPSALAARIVETLAHRIGKDARAARPHDCGQRIRLLFALSAAAPRGYGEDLQVLSGDNGGLRLTFYRGDPDSGDTVDFITSR